VHNALFAEGELIDIRLKKSNCLGRSRFGPKRPILRHTSPIFSSDAPHRTQKLARLALNCLFFSPKTADLNSYKKKTYMNRFIFAFALNLIFMQCVSQREGTSSKITKDPKEQEKFTAQPNRKFPKDWVGNWTGELEIFSATGIQKVPMWVDIASIDTSTQGRYRFGLTYVSKDKDNRPYEVVPIDTAKGIWAVDEKNSIVMEGYVRGPKYICWFVVQNSRVLSTYELQEDGTLVFEITAGREKPVSSTGNTLPEGEKDSIPVVLTYPIGVFQRAILHKQ
jgi:hypothetical protein